MKDRKDESNVGKDGIVGEKKDLGRGETMINESEIE